MEFNSGFKGLRGDITLLTNLISVCSRRTGSITRFLK